MTPAPPHVYEVRFDVRREHNEECYSWIGDDVIDWTTNGDIAGFQLYHSNRPYFPEVKLVFEFDSLGAWSAFVCSADHLATRSRLDQLTNYLDEMLWNRHSIRLTDSTD